MDMLYFESYSGYDWVCENAHLYGFIQRYPEGKEYITGYEYESWHFRYVGVETATIIYERGWTLDEYALLFN
jgi:D-alanyl-D-alanine carboxypeptidase